MEKEAQLKSIERLPRKEKFEKILELSQEDQLRFSDGGHLIESGDKLGFDSRHGDIIIVPKKVYEISSLDLHRILRLTENVNRKNDGGEIGHYDTLFGLLESYTK